jgi:hypothetical protein
MNPKHHTSLKIAKQLVEAGIVIESESQWYQHPKTGEAQISSGDAVIHLEIEGFVFVSNSPIATELLEIMPDGCEYGVNLVKLMSGYGVELTSYKTMPYDRLEFIQDKNPCDALALLLIRLTKDGLI